MKNVKIIKKKGGIEIQTDLGTIIVQPTSDPNYPGVYIDFQKVDKNYPDPICIVEATPNNKEETESVRLLVWTGEEDYSHEFIYAKKH